MGSNLHHQRGKPKSGQDPTPPSVGGSFLALSGKQICRTRVQNQGAEPGCRTRIQNQDAKPGCRVEFRCKEKDAGEDHLEIGPHWFEVP